LSADFFSALAPGVTAMRMEGLPMRVKKMSGREPWCR
jgi:hypothetical protein